MSTTHDINSVKKQSRIARPLFPKPFPPFRTCLCAQCARAAETPPLQRTTSETQALLRSAWQSTVVPTIVIFAVLAFTAYSRP